ncbi:hypothetical protein [Streptomyces yaizuensis]|uniref:Tetratricopeptide repeat protein n=1 Tax=Streptomyces yaizuensis TaxID=2989713 RepID=A0ABQ5NY47_9ACTN|nr:hypothetical protein [Streptomyces sp. YSPA8]GLF95105.1 tetratricopeptide repeat protein [Streptomyces sp. YSPA8]
MSRSWRTPGIWWAGRRFRNWTQPTSRSWPDVHKDVARLTRGLGRWHPETRLARSLVSLWLSSEGRHAEVLALAEEEVADRTAEFGPDDPETLRSRRLLTSALRGVGDLDGAVAGTRAVMEHSARVLGPDHPDTHRCRAALGQYLAENGEPAEGARLLRALYAESLAFGPERYEEARSIRHHLILALELTGGFQEALDLLDEEIADESGTVHGVDEFLGDHRMEHVREWRRRLVTRAASGRPGTDG